MDVKTKAVRCALSRMAPVRSIPVIRSFGLLPDEEQCLIDREARGKSILQIASTLHISPDVVKRKRYNALSKIANELNI